MRRQDVTTVHVLIRRKDGSVEQADTFAEAHLKDLSRYDGLTAQEALRVVGDGLLAATLKDVERRVLWRKDRAGSMRRPDLADHSLDSLTVEVLTHKTEG